jgi:hypothetical protein
MTPRQKLCLLGIAIVLLCCGVDSASAQGTPTLQAQDFLAQLTQSAQANQTFALFNTQIIGDVDLTTLDLPSTLVDGLERVVVPVRLNLNGVTFQDEVYASGIVFQAGADFNNVQFLKGAFFDATHFAENSAFFNATFGEPPDFSEARFEKTFIFRATFSGTADILSFGQAFFGGTASFEGSHFEGIQDVSFVAARFQRLASFSRVHFRKADFALSQFAESADFRGAAFQDGLDLSEVRAGSLDLRRLETAYLSLQDAQFNELLVRDFKFQALNLSLPDDLQLQTINALEQIELTLREQALLYDANEAYYYLRLAQRATYPPLQQLAEVLFLDIPFGYFVRPFNVLAVSGLLILLFALVYYPPSNVLAPLPNTAEETPKANRNAFWVSGIPILPSAAEGSDKHLLGRIWVALGFSFRVFTRLNTSHYLAKKRFFWVYAERLLGAVMLVGLFYTLANSVPLLNELLKTLPPYLK